MADKSGLGDASSRTENGLQIKSHPRYLHQFSGPYSKDEFHSIH